MDSFVARHDAMYSASQVESATQVSFLDLVLTATPANKKIAPLVLFLVILYPPRSAAEYPSISINVAKNTFHCHSIACMRILVAV